MWAQQEPQARRQMLSLIEMRDGPIHVEYMKNIFLLLFLCVNVSWLYLKNVFDEGQGWRSHNIYVHHITVKPLIKIKDEEEAQGQNGCILSCSTGIALNPEPNY